VVVVEDVALVEVVGAEEELVVDVALEVDGVVLIGVVAVVLLDVVAPTAVTIAHSLKYNASISVHKSDGVVQVLKVVMFEIAAGSPGRTHSEDSCIHIAYGCRARLADSRFVIISRRLTRVPIRGMFFKWPERRYSRRR
jgi:hypothetical protein